MTNGAIQECLRVLTWRYLKPLRMAPFENIINNGAVTFNDNVIIITSSLVNKIKNVLHPETPSKINDQKINGLGINIKNNNPNPKISPGNKKSRPRSLTSLTNKDRFNEGPLICATNEEGARARLRGGKL